VRSNEVLVPPAWATQAAGSLRSRAATNTEHSSRAPPRWIAIRITPRPRPPLARIQALYQKACEIDPLTPRLGENRRVFKMDYTSTIAELLGRHGFRRFAMSRSPVGHLKLLGQLDGRPIDIVLDTGASKTLVELTCCRSEGIEVTDTSQPEHGGTVYTLGDVRMTLDGLQLRTDGIVALDMSSTNQRLVTRGVDPIRAVIGQDVLRYHHAVIDYATLTRFLKEEPD
jgi:hypothetical protein